MNLLDNYKDDDLDIFLKTLFTILRDTPIEDITSYIKRMKTIYEGLDYMSSNYYKFLVRVDSSLFAKILDIINDGIQSLDLSVSIHCYNIVIIIVSSWSDVMDII